MHGISTMKDLKLISALECENCYKDYSEESYFKDIFLGNKLVENTYRSGKYYSRSVGNKKIILLRANSLQYFDKGAFNLGTIDDILHNRKIKKIKLKAKKNINFFLIVDGFSVKIFYITKFAFLLNVTHHKTNEKLIVFIYKIIDNLEKIVQLTDAYISREINKPTEFNKCYALLSSSKVNNLNSEDVVENNSTNNSNDFKNIYYYGILSGETFCIFKSPSEANTVFQNNSFFKATDSIYKITEHSIKSRLVDKVNRIESISSLVKDADFIDCFKEVIDAPYNEDHFFIFYKLTIENDLKIKKVNYNGGSRLVYDIYEDNGFYYLFSSKLLSHDYKDEIDEQIKIIINDLDLIIGKLEFDLKDVMDSSDEINNNFLNHNDKIAIQREKELKKIRFHNLCKLYAEKNGVLILQLKGNYYYNNSTSGYLKIIPEPYNRFDKNALSIMNSNDELVGYIDKDIARDRLYRLALLKCTKKVTASADLQGMIEVELDSHLILMGLIDKNEY